MDKPKLAHIMQEDWDYLIILDACRYDYFEKFYGQYLSGKLEKRLSLGSSTREWRDRNFTGKYDDTIYISANPFINSVKAVFGFLGADHFHLEKGYPKSFGISRIQMMTLNQRQSYRTSLLYARGVNEKLYKTI